MFFLAMTRFWILLLLWLPMSASAAVDINALARDPFWLKLGHWKATLTGYESEVDSDHFFLAPNGKSDPRAELAATLDGLRGDPSAVACRYPVRAEWLADKLDEPLADLGSCEELHEWYDEIDPHTVTLIFPAAYLNNPASMYGHTLLRIDPPGGESALTSYAVNFAAQSTESNGLIFAVKGLSGMYAGVFGVMPYYRKVNEYNDLENRDIWEYRLNLSTHETRRLLLHLWALNDIEFDYFFFDENCSYQLLSLLEVARPSLTLTDDYTYQVIPSDTVKQVLLEVGLTGTPVFRPALATRLKHQASFLDDEQIERSIAVVNGESAAGQLPSSDSTALENARVLEFAYSWLRYKHYREGGTQQVSGPIAFELLKARAAYPAGDVFGKEPVPDTAPESGHGSARAMLGVGALDGRHFTELGFRAAYHDHLDPAPGFQHGAAITMFGLKIRDYENGDAQIQSLDLLEIDSLSPRTRVFQPKSWRLHVRAGRLPGADPDNPLVADVGGALGMSWQLGDDSLLYWLHGNARLLADDDLPKGHFSSFGIDAGALWQVTASSALLLELRADRWFGGGESSHRSAEFGGSIALADDWSMRLTAKYHRLDDAAWRELQLAGAYYF